MPATSSIGSFSFIKLAGNPEAIKMAIEVVERKGIDGFEAWNTGFRGREFVLESVVDQATQTKAQELMSLYTRSVGSTQRLNWEGSFFGNVLILNVSQLQAQALASSTGGIAGGGAILRASWTLRTVS